MFFSRGDVLEALTRVASGTGDCLAWRVSKTSPETTPVCQCAGPAAQEGGRCCKTANNPRDSHGEELPVSK